MGNLQRGPYSINPVGQVGKCLQVPQGVPVQNATPVQMYVPDRYVGSIHANLNSVQWRVPRLLEREMGDPARSGADQDQVRRDEFLYRCDDCSCVILSFPSFSVPSESFSPSLSSPFLRPFQVADTYFVHPLAPPNGAGLKHWQCYNDFPAQVWYWNALNRNIWLHNTGENLPPSLTLFQLSLHRSFPPPMILCRSCPDDLIGQCIDPTTGDLTNG